jgi:hypothetical protein
MPAEGRDTRDLVRLNPQGESAVHRADAIIEEDHPAGCVRESELSKHACIACGVRLTEPDLVREETVVESLLQSELVAKPRDVETVRIAQAGYYRSFANLLDELERAGERAAQPRLELAKKLGGADAEPECRDRGRGEVLRRAPTLVQVIGRLGRPELPKFSRANPAVGKAVDGFGSAEFDQYIREIEDDGAD